MNGNQIEGLIGMLATLGILVLLILPSALGALRDRRIDRQLKAAEHARTPTEPTATKPRRAHHGVTRHA
ncbi:hypothetical protein ACGFZB_22660 [Streptomyces cinerochromogenes]|uniref:Uncharacterized protein n=1 Tax=Streptomyces cinerochromogenes TaxID=66422 RepID=A0ABW7B7R6_9ACTN